MSMMSAQRMRCASALDTPLLKKLKEQRPPDRIGSLVISSTNILNAYYYYFTSLNNSL